MPSALDPLRDIMPEARRLAARLRARKAARPTNSDRSAKAARTRAHQLANDPVVSLEAAERLRAMLEAERA